MSFASFPLILAVSLLLAGWTSLGLACLCKLESPETNYCAADWVAHVLVAKRQEGVRMPAGIVDRQTEMNTRHQMKYLQMYKISKEMNVTEQNLVVLPVNVYSASEDAACGILLEPGHEYLLAGQFVNGTMMTGLCRQILLEDLKESRKHDILEWAEVPDKLKQQLARQQLDPLCQQQAEGQQPQQKGPAGGKH